MNRSWIVDRGRDAGALQRRAQRVALVGSNDVLMIGVHDAVRDDGRRDDLARQLSIVMAGDGPAPIVVSGEVAQLDAQNRRLQLVESAVEAGDVADVAILPAVLAQPTHLLRERGVAGGDGAAVSDRAEVLRRIEAERGEVAERPGRAAVDGGAVR